MENVYPIKVTQVSMRGVPDLIICVRGHYVAWELKVDGREATDLQQYVLDEIKGAQGIARTVTPSTLIQHLKELECLAYSVSPQQAQENL